jgi:predicted ATPase
MIRHLTIERFKSIVKLDLELGRINLFIGANGSGKSNIIEALGVLGSAAFGRVDDETLQRRGVRPGVPQLYQTAFALGQNAKDIKLEAISDKEAMLRVTLWNPKNDAGAPWSFKTEKLTRSSLPKGQIISRSPANKKRLNPQQGLAAWATVNLAPGDPALLLMETLRNYAIYAPNTPSLRGFPQEIQTRDPVGLSGARLPEALNELLAASARNRDLQESVDEVRDLIDWASDFSSESSIDMPLSPSAARSRLVIKFEDRFMAKGRNILTGYDASEGALFILYFAVLALHPKAPACLAVDNIDQALNPRLAQKLMAALCSWTKRLNGDRQWLMTAHNPAILDGLPLADPEVRLFTVDRTNKGHTAVRRIDLESARKARPSDEWTLSRMWMNGLLGGVPNV